MSGVNVEIMGQQLKLSSGPGADDDERVRAIAATVDEKIRNIRASGQTVNSINLAILAALQFAEELERLRRDHQDLLSHLESLNRRLSAAIEARD
jgi:cell division protein ZapA